MPSDQLETQAGFEEALARLRRPEQASPPSQVRQDIIGRTTDQQSFILRTDRIRLDEDQVRRQGKSVEDEETQQLAESMREHGLLQAIDVRWLEDAGIYEVAAGERRFVAAVQILSWKEIPVRVVNATDDQLLWLQLHENLQRKDLHALDLADAIRAAMRQGLSLPEVARRLCKSTTWVQKALTTAKELTEGARRILRETPKGQSLEVAYEVAKHEPGEQEAVARAVKEQGLGRQELRRLNAERKQKHPPSNTRKRRGRPLRTRPYRRMLTPSEGVTVTVSFRKATVAATEVLQALRRAIHIVEAERRRDRR